MVASTNTQKALMRVLRAHLTPSQLETCLRELLDVPGNQSFRETVQGLYVLFAASHRGEEGNQRSFRMESVTGDNQIDQIQVETDQSLTAFRTALHSLERVYGPSINVFELKIKPTGFKRRAPAN